MNRILSHLRYPPVKSAIAAVAGLLLLGGSTWLGYTGGWGRVAILLALAGVAAGELNYRLSDRRLRAAAPVERHGPALSLRRPFTTTDLWVDHYHIPLKSVSGGDDMEHTPTGARLRVAHFTDLHLNDHLPDKYFCRVVEAVAEHDPDLVFITGDFVSDADGAAKFPALAQRLSSRYGVYGIFGNHDFWAGRDKVSKVVTGAGVTLLGNGWRRIQAGPFRLLLAGCEEPWSRDRLTLPALEPGERLLVLSHTADHIYRFSRQGATAVFTGHYHAGQFNVPGFGPLFVPSIYGRRFYRGHYQVGETHLFVSAGVGAHEPPWRLYCPPDVLIIDFYS
jgi:predicted MPP superfamily phosphohydrolase